MRMVLLQSIDSHWREHLAALDYLRQGIHLRGYAQKNPKQEYKREAFELFCAAARPGEDGGHARADDGAHPDAGAGGAGRRGARGAGRAQVSNVTYTHPNEDGSGSEERRCASGRAQCRRSAATTLPLRQRQEVQALPRQADLALGPRRASRPATRGLRAVRRQRPRSALASDIATAGGAMPVNLAAPNAADLHPVPGVAHRHRDGRRAQGEPPRPDASSRSTRARASPACSRRTASAPRRCRCAASTWRRAAASARCWSTPAMPTPAPATTAWRVRARPARRWRGSSARARAGAAVLDRRDHGDAAGRSHRGRPAGGAGRPARRTTGREAAAGDHDHRHGAQGGVAAGARSAARPSPSPASPRAPA